MIALMVFSALLVYLGIAWLVIKRLPSKKAKWIAVAVFILIPTWDEILGRVYFKYLCEMEGNQKIYKTFELGKEYFLLPGEINMNTAGRLPAQGGELNIVKAKDRFSFTHESTRVSYSFRIDKAALVIKEIASGEVVATDTRFLYFGGWVVNHTSAHVTGISCPERTDSYYKEFETAIFRPAKVKN